MTEKQQFSFDVEVGKVLNLMINSLYTNKDVALRELISNAADACDKLRYLSSQNHDLLQENEELKISLQIDKAKKLLIITDNGIGMNREELIQNLGTIARSGTENFVKSLTGDKAKDVNLIGQFGVGFYSSFMVADKVVVVSRKYDSSETSQWESDGSANFSIGDAAENLARGTKIILHLKDEASDFLDRFHLKHVVQTYSDHVNLKIEFIPDNLEAGAKIEVLNSGAALWTLPKESISSEQYQAFFKHVSHLPGEPFMTIHNKVEGLTTYTNLLFVPSTKPFDLFHPDRKPSVKLYVKKVFISEDLDLVPAWMRFLRGLIDSDDLPLNISRETLQHNLVLEKIKKSVVNKVLSELKKKALDSEEEYQKFWNNFGAVLKEGLCESSEFREKILEICRFYSSKSPDKLVSLTEYLDRTKAGQDKIFYLTGETVEKIKSSPQLEIFLQKDIEVLFLTDAVDDFWMTVALPYKEKDFQSITRHDIELDNIDKAPSENPEEPEEDNKIKDVTTSAFENLTKFMKEILGEKVKDVRISKKLTDSPVCLAVDSMSMDIRMERYLLDQKQILAGSAKILEINPSNAIVKNLNEKIVSDNGREEAKEAIRTLFDLACIIEGEPIDNAKDFSRRVEKLMR
ncbi:MAG: molecular chaperone HtpG [Rickettsiales bacterium]|nr:molecular chaperone HtpG [Rickettsiales bacterium]